MKPTTAIRKSARGEDCQIRLPEICNYDSATTVYAHYRLKGLGANLKNDLWGAYGCSDCHDVVDERRRVYHLTRHQIKIYFLEGCLRTLQKLKDRNLL